MITAKIQYQGGAKNLLLQNPKDWLNQLANSIKTVEQLEKHFKLSKLQKTEIRKLLKKTRFSITPYLASLMKKNATGLIKKNDPIWIQYGPSLLEEELLEETTAWEREEEMFADGMTNEQRKLSNHSERTYLGQHKYPDRVVIRIAHHCGSYCRFCYERGRTLKNTQMPNLKIAIEQAITYIKTHPEIREVIFTGGDPLALADSSIESWLKNFHDIPNIDSLRIHTRMPAQNPYRITPELIKIFKNYSVNWINIQINHPRELTTDFLNHIRLIQAQGMVVKTQNPIIHRLNDDPKILADFIKKCRANNIQHHHWFHAMPVTPIKMRTSVERMVLLFQNVKKYLGNIRWNASEMGDLTIDHHNGKRTIPFEEIEIDLSKPREKWGTNKFQFSSDKNGKPIIRFNSWNQENKNLEEYFDPHVNLKNLKNSDFIDLL